MYSLLLQFQLQESSHHVLIIPIKSHLYVQDVYAQFLKAITSSHFEKQSPTLKTIEEAALYK